ncbi:multidrug MFS transporter [Vibrio alfacsensis]|uniref:epoxide hydrolase family protein n=1 Tax=Vibrio alfacsensis TaxID=1074311 RepID=UPI001BF08C85|nr:epoxide hydrolase family protein [Vibrio alfacsensis]BBM67411.1 multidrug MFS transporter [Vibrio alfacsensis]
MKNEAIVPFEINIPEEDIADLKRRLEQTRFTDEIDNAGWDYGTNLGYLKQLVQYWLTDFDWRTEEKALNEFDQYKTNIDGLDLHFVHQKSNYKNAKTLVLIHGWPGSFVEFKKVIGPLTDPVRYGGQVEDSFNIVAVSLPGFGFSDRPTKRGYTPERMADTIASLMDRLGYEHYGLQGGDWGSTVSRYIATNYSEHVTGLHLNFCEATPPANAQNTATEIKDLTPLELKRLAASNAFTSEGSAYFGLLSTKPQTVNYAMNDSPTGLAAWMIEKFQSWSDCEGYIEKSFTKDELLTNISLYWFTQTASSSSRIYYEQRHTECKPKPNVTVPTACALFPSEIRTPQRDWVEATYHLVRWTEMPNGGHFAALEEPQLLVDDIRAFFRELPECK